MQAAEGAGECRISRAVVSHKGDDFAWRGSHGDITQHGLLFISQRHILKLQYRRLFCRGGTHRLFLLQIECPQSHALPLFCGQRHKLLRCEVSCDSAVFKVDHAVCYVRKVIEPMLRNDHGLALRLDKLQMLPQFANRRHIQIGRRLVQQIDLRGHGVNRGKGDLLLFAAGKSKDIAAQQVFNMERLGCFRHTLFHPLLRHCLVFHAEGDLAVGVHIEKLRPGILEHAAHLFRNAVHGKIGEVFAVKPNFSA